MEQENIHTAIRIADALLQNKELTDQNRSDIEALKSELEAVLITKQFNQTRLKKIVTELFEWLLLLRPFLKDIIELWI